MGTGVGTESGAEGGSRGDLSRESQRERARGRGGSAPGRPDLSGLTSFFLSLSFFPPLCLPVPSPMAKPCGLAPPLFLRYLALSLSLSLSLPSGLSTLRALLNGGKPHLLRKQNGTAGICSRFQSTSNLKGKVS